LKLITVKTLRKRLKINNEALFRCPEVSAAVTGLLGKAPLPLIDVLHDDSKMAKTRH